jgi:hypothetical protein
MTTEEPTRPNGKRRLLAIAFYLGLAPVLGWLRLRRKDAFVQHHYAQALAVVLVVLTTGVALLVASVGWSWVIIRHREVIEALPWGSDLAVVGVILSVVTVLWAAGIGLAIAGSMRQVPLLRRLTVSRRAARLALAGNGVALVLIALITVLTLHAAALTRGLDDRPAPVYVLYDDMQWCPRWVFQLGAYRIALAARERWGEGSVVVAPLDEHSLKQALRHGRFVVLLCHGREGYVVKDKFLAAPPPPVPATRSVCVTTDPTGEQPWEYVPVGDDLRFVYVTACDAGQRADDWQAALTPAEVITFDRLSAMLEHVWWLWIPAPQRVKSIP